MKSLKKLIVVLLLVLLIGVGVGCDISINGGKVDVDDHNNTTKVDLDDVYSAVLLALGDRTKVESDLVFPASKDGVLIVWSSSNPEVLGNDGKVTRPLDDTKVTITIVLKYGEETKQYSFNVTVKGNRADVPDGYDKIGELIAQEAGVSASVRGTVVGLTSQSFLVKDDTGFILVYQGKNFKADVKVGNIVVVNGVTAEYAGMKQFGTDATYTIEDGQGTDNGTFETLDVAKFDALATEANVKLVSITGKLLKSGNYWNLEVSGATNKGSVSYPAQNLDEYDGKNVVVTGYFVGVTGSSTKYINFILVNIKLSDNQGGNDTPIEATSAKISEVISAEAGNYEINGVVAGVTSQSFLVTDDSKAFILVYVGKEWQRDLEIGDNVKVTGTTTKYAGMMQFGAGSTYVKGTSTTYDAGNPELVDGTLLDTLGTDLVVKYVTVNGDLAKSGNYWNLTVAGATLVGSISYPYQDINSFDGKNVDVTGYFVGVTGSSTKYATIILTDIKEGVVTPITSDPVTVSEVLNGTVGAAYKTSGVAIAVNSQSFLLKDDTGTILVYLGSDYQKDINVGDVVNIEGKTSTYKGSVQFNKPTYQKTEETKTVTHPEPHVLTLSEFDALDTDKPVIDYVTIVGELQIDDKYVNIIVTGSLLYGSVAYPVEDFKSLDGKFVEVTGYYLYTTGSEQKYVNIMATSVKEVSDEEVVALIKAEIESYDKFDCCSDIELIANWSGATLTWVSSNPEVFSNEGKYLAPQQNTEVKLTATITKGQKSATAEMNIVVLAPETIGSILASAELDNETHIVKGIVVATNARGFLVKDDTGYLLVYKGNAYPKDLAIGQTVLIVGLITEYGGAKQFGQDAVYSVLSEGTFTQPEPRELDQAAFEALGNEIKIEYVKLSGILEVTGTYYNIAVGTSELKGSIAYPVENLAALNGKKITVIGYFVYIGQSNKYPYFVATSVEETPLTDQESVDFALAEVLKMNGKSFKKDLVLPLESNGCTIAWVSSNTEVIASDGKFTMPASDTEVTLTATITKGEVTKVSEIKVIAKYVDPNAVLPIVLDLGKHDDFATWSNTYMAHELVFDDVKVEFTRVDRQTGTVTDAPVMACNASNSTVYAIVTGNLEGMKYARVITKEWNAGATAKYGDIHLEYSTDGETWITCSDVFTEPGTMLSTEMTNIKAFRVSYSMKEGSSGNAQLPLVSIEFAGTAFPNE